MRDYPSNLDHNCSVKSGSALSGTTPVLGTSKAFSDHIGPVAAVFATGAAANTPSTQAHVCKLQESPDGTNSWTDITGATATITSDSTSAMVQGIRTQPYVRCHVTPAFTGGSSPTNTVSGVLLMQRAQVS